MTTTESFDVGTERESCLDAALAHARRGWPVFPVHGVRGGECTCGKVSCDSAGKHPRTLNGLKDASTDGTIISAWWSRWPGANLAIATGAKSGLLVLDIDPRHGGDESLADLEKQHGQLPNTPRCITGGGGLHVFFAHPGDTVRNRAGIMPGIDVRGDGGYVVAAPSVHVSGRTYEWDATAHPDDVPFAPAPRWLLDLLAKPRVNGHDRTAAGTIAEGKRHAALVAEAGRLRRLGYDPDVIGATLDAFNAKHCDPPLGADEVASIARSAGDWPPGPEEPPPPTEPLGAAPRAAPDPEPERPVGEEPEHLREEADLDEIEAAQLREADRLDRLDAEQPPPEIASEHYTDLGNAQRFARHYGGDVRYVALWKKFLAWDETRWTIDTTGAAMRLAKRIPGLVYAEAARAEEKEIRDAIAEHAKRSESARSLKALLELAQTEQPIAASPEDFDRDPWLLNTPTCTVDLRTGESRRHRRDDYFTKITGAPYEPQASAPTWERHLARILPDLDVRDFLQRYIGYALTGVIREHVLLIAWGSGANGKSTTLEAIRYALGEYGQNAPAEVLLAKRDDGPLNELARLRGVRFTTVVESEETARLAESRVKRLTGGDALTARFLFGEFFDFSPTAKLILCTNHKPRIRGTDLAIWRRINLVPFTITIPESERDLLLLEKLKAEAAGILAWLVRGCLAWQERGLDPPEAVRAATESYRSEQDVVGRFIADCCVVAASAVVTSAALFKAFTDWCEQNREPHCTQTAFAARLHELGFENRPHGKGRTIHWFGLGLATTEETP